MIMALTEDQRARVDSFRTFVEESCVTDERYGEVSRLDREDESLLACRFAAAPHCWLEVALRPMIPQVRVGFVTDDRWKSEEAEDLIESSGDSMNEFVEMGFSEAGLDWNEPPVEHFREAGQFFYFATPLEIESLDELERDEIRSKTLRMLEGYLIAFGGILSVPEEG